MRWEFDNEKKYLYRRFGRQMERMTEDRMYMNHFQEPQSCPEDESIIVDATREQKNDKAMYIRTLYEFTLGWSAQI
jgi:hypothetical protein